MFLKPLLDTSEAAWTLRNARSGMVLAEKLETAFESAVRRRGLLGRSGLDTGTALIIAPCNSIHTFFMKFAIDAVFVSRDGRVRKVYSALPPWRIGFSWNAFAVIELRSSGAARAGTRIGDILEITR